MINEGLNFYDGCMLCDFSSGDWDKYLSIHIRKGTDDKARE